MSTGVPVEHCTVQRHRVGRGQKAIAVSAVSPVGRSALAARRRGARGSAARAIMRGPRWRARARWRMDGPRRLVRAGRCGAWRRIQYRESTRGQDDRCSDPVEGCAWSEIRDEVLARCADRCVEVAEQIVAQQARQGLFVPCGGDASRRRARRVTVDQRSTDVAPHVADRVTCGRVEMANHIGRLES